MSAPERIVTTCRMAAMLWWTPRDSSATVRSTMARLIVDRSDPTLLHDQVAAEIRRAIADGEAKPGEKLPTARDLAAVLGVNSNTVLRALRLLRDEGLLEFRRGHGITVTGAAPKRSIVLTKAQELLQVARREGYRRDELIRLIETLP
jgi:GntR family transcriptional regulator